MYIEDMTSLSVRPIHKLGFTNPIGANPCDTGYSHISEDEYEAKANTWDLDPHSATKRIDVIVTAPAMKI